MDKKEQWAEWWQAVKGVKPLKKAAQKVQTAVSDSALSQPESVGKQQVEDWDNLPHSTPPTQPMAVETWASQLEQAWQNPPEPQPQAKCTIIEFSTERFVGADPSLDNRTLKRLAEGAYPIQARVDLHGFTLDEAWPMLMDTLNHGFQQGFRCVLVIHGKGKGYGPKDDMGVIKANTSAWLAAHPQVMAFHTCQPRHGGAGAVYVLLRKNKEL